MKELFRERELETVSFYKQLLENEGIPCLIRNENLTMSGLTDFPIPEFFPALNVLHDEDYQRAMEIIRQQLHETRTKSAGDPDQESPCPSCGEMNPQNFAQCWSCDSSLSG